MIVELEAVTRPIKNETKHMNLGEYIAYVARVSNPSNQINTETSPKLLAYLVKNKHWSPFEMAGVTMKIVTTRDISHQIIRHRSFSYQEFSQRYALVSAEPVYREARLQDKKNRQNSLEVMDAELKAEWIEWQSRVNSLTQEAYAWAIDKGIAKEVSRAVLPEGITETTIYMSGTVRSWIHYIQVRGDPSTQKEHREVAEGAREELQKEIDLVL